MIGTLEISLHTRIPLKILKMSLVFVIFNEEVSSCCKSNYASSDVCSKGRLTVGQKTVQAGI